MSVIVGEQLVRKWLHRFGFGHYRIHVHPMDVSGVEHAWALCHFEPDEEWAAFWLPDDDALPVETLEIIVLHELSHGLIKLARDGGVYEEQICNRIARLTLGDWTSRGAEEYRSVTDADFYVVDDDSDKRQAVAKRDWLSLVADALPQEQRDVISMLYWEGLSLRDAADQLHVDVHTVFRRRQKALTTLRNYFDALDQRFD